MKLKEFVSYWFPVLAYMVLIFYMSSLPNASFNGINSSFGLNDKIEHFVEYFVLGYLLFRLFRHYKKKNPGIKAVAISALYGLTDEMHQLFVPSRVFSFNDLLYDFLGSLVSVIVFLVLIKAISVRKK